MAKLFALRVAEIKRESIKASTVYLDIPIELREKFQYRAGQYLTVEMEADGDKIRRAYSICTSPHESLFGFTVKQIVDGKMSTFLNQQLKVGDYLQILPPQGKFVHTTQYEARITYYLLGAGSGITPLYSLLKDILESEPLSTVHLLYGNRDASEIIYHSELQSLSNYYKGQCYLKFFLSKPQKLLFIDHWDGQVGRLDSAALEKYLSAFPKQTIEEKFFICGPDQMIEQLSDHLTVMEKGEHILSERFNNKKVKMESQPDRAICKAKIHLDGETVEIDIKNQSILQTLIDGGYDPPFSCTSGVCTTCMAKLKSGQVEMDVNYGLDEDEVAEGYILTCQSHPSTKEIELTYDI